MAYGTVFDKQTAAKYLQEANRDVYGRKTWESAIGSIQASGQVALSSAKTQYGEAMNQAYLQAQNQKADLAASNIFGGVDAYNKQIDDALEQAYAQYYNNYLKSVSDVATSANQQLETIQTALDTQAEQNVSMYNTFYPYLQYVYDKAMEDENTLFTDEYAWSRFISDGALISEEDFQNLLYDSEGNLALGAAETYDQLMSELGTRYGEGYDYFKFLFDTNPELYEWATQQNYYDYAPNRTGISTNLSSFRTSLGLPADFGSYEQNEELLKYASARVGEIDIPDVDYKKLRKYLMYNRNKFSEYSNQYYDDLLDIAKYYEVEDEFVSKFGDKKEFEKYLSQDGSEAKFKQYDWFKEIKGYTNQSDRYRKQLAEDPRDYLVELIRNKNAKS